MFDFHKSDLAPCFKNKLLENSFLEFQTRFNRTTGEEHFKSTAYFKGLKFTIYDIDNRNCRITIEGSFHKYWNDGKHNFNDFNIEDLEWVLKDIKDKFDILPSDCQIKQLEVGLNFKPPYPTKKILQSCLLHKTKPFKWVFVGDEGNYIQAYHNNYIIKIYDKQKHYQLHGYNIPMPIMRFEIKFRKEKLNYLMKNAGVITLQDILDFGIENFEMILLSEWKNVLYYDFEIFDNTILQNQYNNPNYWLSLKKENFKYHRKKMNKKVNLTCNSLQKRISVIMQKKFEELMNPALVQILS